VIQSHFFDKGIMLISRRYQLHPASAPTKYPKSIKDTHSQKTKKKIREKKDHAIVVNFLQQPHRTTNVGYEAEAAPTRHQTSGTHARKPSLHRHQDPLSQY
jgi:hypothetical protein